MTTAAASAIVMLPARRTSPESIINFTRRRGLNLSIASCSYSSSSSRKQELILYSKPGCCLCDGLKEKLHSAFSLSSSSSSSSDSYPLHDVHLQIRDITSNPVLARLRSDGTEKVVQEDGQLLPEFADADEQELYEALNLMLESDLDAEQNRHYEVVYLIHENFEEEVEKVNLKIQEFLSEKKGRVHRFSDWGLRRLAYKIQKAKNAHYILMNFEIDAKWINDFKSMLDKDERIIRHLVMKQDEAITEECTPPPEFHTLRADMDDNYDDDDDDDDDEYDEDDDDESDVIVDNGDDPGIIYVDADEDQENDKDRKPESLKIGGRRKLEKARKF